MTRSSPRKWRRSGLAIVAATLSIAAAFVVLPLALRAVLYAFDLVLTGTIWLTTSLGSDADTWTILVAVARALAAVLLSTKALAVMGLLVLVSALALYGLQRLLGMKEESSS